MGLVVGLDVGGSWVRAALATQGARILNKIAEPVSAESPEAFLGQLEAITLKASGQRFSSVERIGIGMAGRLDLKSGALAFYPHSPLKDIPIKGVLELRLGKNIVLINDNAAAALAEKSMGAGIGHENIVYVGIGTGIGGGAVVDNRLLSGKDGNAHEFGHMMIDIDGRLKCSCGGRGHWEAYTSGAGLPNFARQLARDYGYSTPLIRALSGGEIDAKRIFDHANSEDKFAMHVLERAARINAHAIANLVNLYDPSLITIGGGVALKNSNAVITAIASLLPHLTFNQPPAVLPTPLGEDASLLGAVIAASCPLTI